MPRRLLRTSLTVLGTAGALCAAAPVALASFPGDNGRIALRSGDPGGDYISSIGANGSDGRHLAGDGNGVGPAWSPSGARLAFSRTSEVMCGDITTSRSELHIGDEMGDSAQSLGLPDSDHPAFSPDGNRIAFNKLLSFDTETCDRGASDLWVANADGTEARRIGGGGEPEWSPDGASLVVSSSQDGRPGLFLLNPDGTNRRRLTTGSDGDASWAPDGRKVAFTRFTEEEGYNMDVMKVNADGTGESRITETGPGTRGIYAEQEQDPLWAPDGKSLAYIIGTGEDTIDVYMTDPAGGTHVKAFSPRCGATPDDCRGGVWGIEAWQPLPAGSNLLPNPSFERDLSGWGSFAGTLTRVAQSGAPDGTYVAKATRASGATKFSISDGQGGFKETIPFTSAGETYVGSVRVKAASSSSVGKPVTVYLREKSASRATVRESKVSSTLSSSWKKIAVSAKVSGTGNSLGLRVEQTSAVSGNAFYGDAFGLTKARTQVGAATAPAPSTTMGGDSKRVSKVSVATGFDAVRLRAFLDGKGGTSGSQSVRGVIYADSNGAPGARVGSTSSVSIAAGRTAGWVDFELSTPVSLKAGSYWVGLQSSTPSAVARWAGTSKAGALRLNTDAYSDGAASSFGTARSDDKEMALQVVGG